MEADGSSLTALQLPLKLRSFDGIQNVYLIIISSSINILLRLLVKMFQMKFKKYNCYFLVVTHGGNGNFYDVQCYTLYIVSQDVVIF